MAAVALTTALEIELNTSTARVVAVVVVVVVASSEGGFVRNGLRMGSRVNMNKSVENVIKK